MKVKEDKMWRKAFWVWFIGGALCFDFVALSGIISLKLNAEDDLLSMESVATYLVVMTLVTMLVALITAGILNRILAAVGGEPLRTLALGSIIKSGRNMALYFNPFGWCVLIALFVWRKWLEPPIDIIGDLVSRMCPPDDSRMLDE